MPQRSNVLQSILASLKQQSTKALASLHQEISTREKELAVLKKTEAQWRSVVGAQPKAATPAAAPSRPRAATKKRLNWDTILARLPATFTNKEVRQRTHKPMEQVYAGVSRWVKDNKVKRNPEGKYQKITPPAAQKKAAA
ncbi:MAG: hypothetical protein HYZ72_16060 [Deltaproteobacteria bacterium]|nr:hypothetical protein [Deltaproteobacteria bacterium]